MHFCDIYCRPLLIFPTHKARRANDFHCTFFQQLYFTKYTNGYNNGNTVYSPWLKRSNIATAYHIKAWVKSFKNIFIALPAKGISNTANEGLSVFSIIYEYMNTDNRIAYRWQRLGMKQFCIDPFCFQEEHQVSNLFSWRGSLLKLIECSVSCDS